MMVVLGELAGYVCLEKIQHKHKHCKKFNQKRFIYRDNNNWTESNKGN